MIPNAPITSVLHNWSTGGGEIKLLVQRILFISYTQTVELV